MANSASIKVGEDNKGTNLLPGEGVFAQKNNSTLEFKGLSGLGTITVTSTANSVLISGSIPSGEANTASNLGGDEGLFWQKTGVNLEFRGITAADSVVFTSGSTAVTIGVPQVAINATDIAFVSGVAASAMQDLIDDGTPQLGGPLDVLGHDIRSSTGDTVLTYQGNFDKGIYIQNSLHQLFWDGGAGVVADFGVGDGSIFGAYSDGASFSEMVLSNNMSRFDFALSGVRTSFRVLSEGVEIVNAANNGGRYLKLPSRPTANRPTTPADGMIGYNSTTTHTEMRESGVWYNVARGEDVTFISGNYVSSASNLLEGEGIFKQKTTNDLEFKGITGLGNVTVTSDANTVFISGVIGGGGGEVNTASNLGGDQGWFFEKSGFNLAFRGITAGQNIALTSGSTAVTVSTTDTISATTLSGTFVSGDSVSIAGLKATAPRYISWRTSTTTGGLLSGTIGSITINGDFTPVAWEVSSTASGAGTIDVRRQAEGSYTGAFVAGDSIAGTEKITINNVNGVQGQDTSLSSWSGVNAGDRLSFHLEGDMTSNDIDFTITFNPA